MGKRRHSSPSDSDSESISNRALIKRISKLEKKLKKAKRRERGRSEYRSKSRSRSSSRNGRAQSSLKSQSRSPSPSRARVPVDNDDWVSIGPASDRGSPSIGRTLRGSEIASVPNIRASVEGNENVDPGILIHNDEILPDDILDILGTNPNDNTKENYKLHDAIKTRWAHILENGLSPADYEKTKSSILKPENLTLNAPKVNPEITTILTTVHQTRDALHSNYQNQLGLGMSALGQALNIILQEENKLPENVRNNLLSHLSDSGRILANLFNNISKVRRTVITPLLSRNIKKMADTTLPSPELLFGPNLTELIKSAKQLETTGKELKASQPTNKYAVMRNFYQKKGGGRTQSGSSHQPENYRRPVRRQRRETKPLKGHTSRHGQNRSHSRRRY